MTKNSTVRYSTLICENFDGNKGEKNMTCWGEDSSCIPPVKQCRGSGPALDLIRIQPLNSDQTGPGSYFVKYNGPSHYYYIRAA